MKQLIVFGLIWVIYFSGAVGLYNSMDSPQYFTTESIIQHGSLDLNKVQNSNHFFVYPDTFHGTHGELYGVRGYLNSFIGLPVNLLARILTPFINTNNFLSQITPSSQFRLELATTSLYSAVMVFALVGLYAILRTIKLPANQSLLIVLISGLGSYFWKYSTSYTRLSISSLLLVWYLYSLNRKKYFYLFIITSLSFGIDIWLFISFSLISIYIFSSTYCLARLKQIILPIILLILLSVINLTFYNDVLSFQTYKQPTILSIVGNEKSKSVWLSTPFWPTITNVIFSNSVLDNRIFTNFDLLPPAVAEFASVKYAKMYTFNGIFTISPFLYFAGFSVFILLKSRVHLLTIILILVIGIVGNLKVLQFWGGNQYDIRYFTPYVIIFAYLVGIGFKQILKLPSYFKYFGYLIFFILSIRSILMGWLGVLGMYLPALTGERRVWIGLENYQTIIRAMDIEQVIKFTFWNWQNSWIPMVLVTITGYLLFRFHNKFQ